MSPIIDIQRRLVEAGRIRAGDRNDSGFPRKLAEWRLTSKDRARLEAAAGMWGGDVRPWEGHEGEFELYTKRAELPVMLMPDQIPSTWYELWTRGGCERRCDGEHEMLSDKPCLCGDERECKPTTRLPVLLPDVPGLGTWLLSSTGWNAAAELAASAELLGRATAQGVFIPARLRLEQRVEVKGGQTRRYAVPVIDIDVTLREVLGQAPVRYEIGQGGNAAAATVTWTPVAAANTTGSTLTQALTEVEQQQPHRGPRSAPPIATADDDIFEEGAVPVPVPAEGEAAGAPEENGEHRTPAQTRKLNVLVGRLRDAGRITTEQLWSAVATLRQTDTVSLCEEMGGVDLDGVWHWSPLRDGLSKTEASNLIDRLERLESNVAAMEASQ